MSDHGKWAPVPRALQDFVDARPGWAIAQFIGSDVYYGNRIFEVGTYRTSACSLRVWPGQVAGHTGWAISCATDKRQALFEDVGDDEVADRVRSIERTLGIFAELKACRDRYKAREMVVCLKPQQIRLIEAVLNHTKSGSWATALQRLLRAFDFDIEVDQWRLVHV